MPDHQETRKRLEQFMEHLEISRPEFIKKTEIDRGQLSKILRGDQEPGNAALRKITTVFPELNLRWLVTGLGEMLVEELTHEEKTILNSYRASSSDRKDEWMFVVRVQFFIKEEQEVDRLNENIEIKDPSLDLKQRKKLKMHLWDLQERRRWLDVKLYLEKKIIAKSGLLYDDSKLDEIEENLETVKLEIDQWVNLKSELSKKLLEES